MPNNSKWPIVKVLLARDSPWGRVTQVQSINFMTGLCLGLGLDLVLFASLTIVESGPQFTKVCPGHFLLSMFYLICLCWFGKLALAQYNFTQLFRGRGATTKKLKVNYSSLKNNTNCNLHLGSIHFRSSEEQLFSWPEFVDLLNWPVP